MIEMKYIIVDSDEYGEEIFIFPKNINHDYFYECVSDIKPANGDWVYREVVSAGFTDGVKCYGRSESLDVGSREIDTNILMGKYD